MPQVRLIGADGEQVGIMDTDAAMERAEDIGLDLVRSNPMRNHRFAG